MAERVPVAHFADPGIAELAADFLEIRGFDAAALDKSGYRSPGGGIVLVPRKEAVLAVALLHRVRKGDFAEPYPDIPDAEADIMVRLSQALKPSDFRPSWLHHLPIIVIGAAIVLALAGLLIAAALL